MAKSRTKAAPEKELFRPLPSGHAARLDAIARVTGAIAHDFNNILMLVNGYADLVLNQTAADDRRRADLAAIQQAGQRATSLTRQLLASGRRQPVKPVLVSVSDLLRGERETLQRELPSSITLELALDEAAPEIRADPGQLVRAVVELLHNARDAMPEGGTATLRTEASADSATVHVCDTGRGVPAEARPRLFEPFFTTKPRGVGKGLGLAFVYGVVSQAGGEVGVYSKPGRGAVFSMRFPRAAG